MKNQQKTLDDTTHQENDEELMSSRKQENIMWGICLVNKVPQSQENKLAHIFN